MTKYTYNALDFVTQINYNGGKQASYRYNKVGELVENKALQNHFDSKVWRSSTRELVEEKYYTAIVTLLALIESSDVEIKKAEEKFLMKAILPAEKC